MSIHNYLNSGNTNNVEWLWLNDDTQLLLMHSMKGVIEQYFLIKFLKSIINC